MPEKEIEELSARNQEIMKRLLEGQNSRQISEALQLQPSTIRTITTSPMFKRELQKRRETEIRSIATRLEDLTPEAIDVLKDYMRQKGNYERQRLSAALEILDRAGYVKIQKQITVGINAEDVIKALARLRAGEAVDELTMIEAEVINDNTTRAGVGSGLPGGGGLVRGDTRQEEVPGIPPDTDTSSTSEPGTTVEDTSTLRRDSDTTQSTQATPVSVLELADIGAKSSRSNDDIVSYVKQETPSSNKAGTDKVEADE